MANDFIRVKPSSMFAAGRRGKDISIFKDFNAKVFELTKLV